ncbi:MAG: DUF937 domain-containing protein [Xanthomonadales bacterium]|nr:DUF937 domain-containing protein [Xanthomonadales bacterium]
MDPLQLGAQLLGDKLGLKLEPSTVQSALSSLMGDGKGGIDLQGLVSQFSASGGLGDLVQSWLGDGGNLPISADQISGLFGQDKMNAFAGAIGTDAGQAAGGLADMLPQLLDQSSSGGSLLDMAGGAEGLMGMAKSFLR